MPTVDEIQAMLQVERAKIEQQLGIGQATGDLERVAAAARSAKQALKRGRDKPKRESAPVIPTRRSTRVQGITVDGAQIPPPVAEPYNVGGDKPSNVPEGDVPWDATLWKGTERKAGQDAAAAAHLLDYLREGAASLMGVPAPPPLRPLAAAAETAPEASSSAPEETPAAAGPDPSVAGSPSKRRGPARGSKAPEAAAASSGSSAAAGDEASKVEEAGEDAASAGSGKAAAALQASRSALPGCGLATATLLKSHSTVGQWPRDQRRPASALTALTVRREEHVMKVTPDRIYSVTFHPSPHRIMALAGDKNGHLGLWVPDAHNPSAAGSGAGGAKRARLADAAAAAGSGAKGADDEVEVVNDADDADEDEEDADDGRHTVALFRPHSAPISFVIVPVGAPHVVLTASYDGSVRSLDLNLGHSLCLSTAGEEGRGVSAVEVDAVTPGSGASETGVSVWLGGYDGTMYHVDSRMGEAASAPQWAGHEKKVTSISCPRGGGSNLLVSGASDSVVRVWDVRKLPRQGASNSGRTFKPAALAELPHPVGITSALVSPWGSHVVTTCNDNKLRVFELNGAGYGTTGAASSSSSSGSGWAVKEAPSTAIFHDNHTGRWLSQFRTVWDAANEDTFVVGSMTRHLEVYSAASGARLSAVLPPLVTAVGPLTAVHPCPTTHVIAAGTGSGRMYLYT